MLPYPIMKLVHQSEFIGTYYTHTRTRTQMIKIKTVWPTPYLMIYVFRPQPVYIMSCRPTLFALDLSLMDSFSYEF